MGAIFSRERFGRPQITAGLMLLVFMGECAWLIAHEYHSAFGTSEDEFVRIEEGLAQYYGRGIAGTPSVRSPLDPTRINTKDDLYDHEHSPLWYLIASAPVAGFRLPPDGLLWIWLTRAPYLLFGTLLGASLWYVSRRLYGNAGGYIALALYCSSPFMIRSSALWVAPPNIGGAWGTFGAVFTAIAVSHTLYAPREVVLWNWRRTILLGISLALAVGSQFGLTIIVPVLLAFMLYLAPGRKAAAIAILAAACVIALVLLFSSYFFHAKIFLQSLRHASLLGASRRSATMAGAYLQVLRQVAESGPVLLVLAPAALTTYLGWRRTRYFGNTAPLIIAVLFICLRILAPHDTGSIFSLSAVVFLLVFIAGIAADLLETKLRELVSAVLLALLTANALWDFMALAKIGR
jgi:hypothetical protein